MLSTSAQCSVSPSLIYQSWCSVLSHEKVRLVHAWQLPIMHACHKDTYITMMYRDPDLGFHDDSHTDDLGHLEYTKWLHLQQYEAQFGGSQVQLQKGNNEAAFSKSKGQIFNNFWLMDPESVVIFFGALILFVSFWVSWSPFVIFCKPLLPFNKFM